jgi:hypothetical protein
MDQIWQKERDLTICYGRQQIIDSNGNLIESATHETNNYYCRIQNYAGLQPSEMWAALVQQIPNDGFMILTSAAQRVRMNEGINIGTCCDQEFTLRLSQDYCQFYFINFDLTQYRISDSSLSSQGLDTHYLFDLLLSFKYPKDLEPICVKRLKRLAPIAVSRWLSTGKSSKAAGIYFSQYYPILHRLTLRGIVQLLLLLLPSHFLIKIFQTRLRTKTILNTE